MFHGPIDMDQYSVRSVYIMYIYLSRNKSPVHLPGVLHEEAVD